MSAMISESQKFNRGIVTLVSGLLVFFCLHLKQAAAQDNPKDLTEIPIEKLGKLEVYSASKFSQKASEAPASISIVTASDIYRYGYRNFDDILRSVTGFYVTYDRNYAYVGARGFGLTGDYNSRILLLVDGHRLNDNIYASSSIGTDFPIALDLIERVEIVRGPGSSLYGTNAFFAVINVIPKRGRTFNGGYASLEAGSRQAYQGTATFGHNYSNGLEVLLSGSYMDSKGYRRLYFPEFDSSGNNNGIAEDADTDRGVNAFMNVAYRNLNMQFVYKHREKRFPTAAFETVFNDRRAQTMDTGGYLDIKFQRSYQGNWDILARTFIDAYDSIGDYPSDYSSSGIKNIVINKDIVSGRWWGGEGQLTHKIAGKHHVTVGTEWRYSFRANQTNYDENEYYLYLNSRLKTTELAAYIQGEATLHENLLLSAGVRYDHYSTFGSTTNPRVALVYSPWERTTAKVLYGHAFRAPNLFELYYQDGITSEANPNLRPEKIQTLEYVVEQYLSPKFRVAGSAYKYWVHRQIRQEIDPDNDLIIFNNSDSIRAQGIQLELEGKNLDGIDGRISYTLQRTIKLPGLVSLPNSPQHIAQLNLFLPLFRTRGGTSIEMRYMSSRKTLSNSHVGGFLVTNVTGFYRKLFPNLDLSAGIFNLLNKRYSDPGGAEHVQDALMQDGRAFWVRIGYGSSTK
jgi:outer membrane receptor for ferrienterochelin and colicins